MIYFIKILDMRKKKYTYVMHYDHFSGELLTTDDIQERQEYLSEDSLIEDLNAIIKDENFDIKHNQLIIGAW